MFIAKIHVSVYRPSLQLQIVDYFNSTILKDQGPILSNAKLSTINYKTPPPAHPCNVVFNLKSPLGDTKPNNFSPIFFVLR